MQTHDNTTMTDRRIRHVLVSLLLTGLLGCQDSQVTEMPPVLLTGEMMVPCSGVVTLNGKPLAGAVLTFLPRSGVPGLGETDKEGKYTLKTAAFQGIPPGEYKVAVSYLVSAKGRVLDLGPRSAQVPSPELLTAKEQLPPEYADIGRCTLHVKVVPGGGNQNFDLQSALELPTPKTPEAVDEVTP